MKKTTCTVLIASLCWIFIGASGSWFSLARSEKYLSDFTLPPNQTKEISIQSRKSRRVISRVDATGESMDTIARGPYPITMMQVGHERSVSSFCGGLDCIPINEKIKLRLTNTSRKPYKVLVVIVE